MGGTYLMTWNAVCVNSDSDNTGEGALDELDGWDFEHCVVFFADKTGVFDCFLDYIMDILWDGIS
jgi:hypothetical protein